MAVMTSVGSHHSIIGSSTLANRASTATLSRSSQPTNSSTQVAAPLSSCSANSSTTLVDDGTANQSCSDQQHLTEANLLQHQQRYNDAAVALKEEAQARKLQEVGSKLGFDLPLHRYEKDKWKPY
ncbi:hypothetical protein PtrSN002B_008054 [Pyrenophora tritici-repentis]|uniref:Uncharacterized protein n=2 Tax=Pyrenophora tritici-repentis TaxID=45151 RepID=A0A2W1HGE7_9PLEO|nr:uncharacterized protein PTRG_09721 [Pyrenophora tritici-repentis Pt-1C-BFP]KAA8617916.1 hypothetical protein PtrV1_09423 [Pyrenophora tritici-repentis]EDU42772.1 predicted protein [Pyrenophora tritici-repentis Pt-1C-BFP]KAF7443126.1 hypothetical protein A1F99_126330 [Pyrenophora tritici-repentis]KAF7568399.1 hypothetical protein PtrM4_130120 [Pyrenophora tritici-repentis]KAI0573380.1 hypothetical protein Alg215_09219 [Pyrenophora tritici-repentis]